MTVNNRAATNTSGTMADTATHSQSIRTTCAVVGGGPAGVMLGVLLARAGVDVVVLEKHKDFLRDFRGDTIHPSTLDVIGELGWLDEFLRLPHQEARHLSGFIGNKQVQIADFTHLPTRCPFIALMPQWNFLDFLARKGGEYPAFHLHMQTEATDLIEERGRVTGVRARSPAGWLEIAADLVIGADGRHSVLRERAGLIVQEIGAPIDVLWMRLTRRQSDGSEPLGRAMAGRIFIMIDRGEYWQCAFVIAKGGYDAVRAKGLEAFRTAIVEVAPQMRDRVGELKSWDDIKLLTVKVDRLRQWYRPGLLCIGDAAHAMSPVGGVGINLAIQDAVAAANLLSAPLRTQGVTVYHLAAVERRRLFPTRATQWLQVQVQNRILSRVLAAREDLSVPWPARLIDRCPLLQRLPARIVGVGFRPEHVRN